MDLVRYRKWFLLGSGVLVLVALLALAVPPALQPGIDFTGGAAFQVEFDSDVTSEQVYEAVAGTGHPEAIVQAAGEEGDNAFFVRIGDFVPAERDADGNIVVPGDRQRIESALNGLGSNQIVSFDTVSGTIGAENVRNAIIALVVAAGAVMLYIAWAFRRIPSPFRYGTAAIVALLHDVVLVLGVFSIMGKVADWEVNTMFLTGLLTLIGYSVNDTIVVFDRIRENQVRYLGAPLGDLVNMSVRDTIGRSLNTSITTLVVVASLLIFATGSISPLLYVIGAGVVVGSYSSIFVASMLLVAWEHGEIGRFFSFLPFVQSKSQTRPA